MSWRIMHCHILASILLLAPLLSATAGPHSFQEGSAASQQETATPEQPQPILEGEIPSRANVAAADLRRIDALLQPPADISRIESALTDRETAIVALHRELDGIDLDRISTRRLEDQRIPWIELRAELDAWGSVVRERFGALQDERELLREERQRWEGTAQRAVADELAPELLRRIDDLLARVTDVEARVLEQRNAIGAIVDRVATSQEVVAESLQDIDAIAERMRGRLFDRNAAPLWLWLGTVEVQPLVEDVIEAREHWVQAFFAYLGLRRGRLAFLLVLFVALLFGAFGLRRRGRGWPAADEALERARSLIGRPFSVALAFALAITVLVLSNPVGSATDVLIVLAIVPMIRIGSVVLAPTARRALYSVAALTILVRISSLGPDGSPLRRLLLLLVTILAFAATAFVALRARRLAVELSGWHPAAVAATSVAAVVLGIALGANVLGWLELSKLLTDATVASLFGAVAWAVVVGVTAVLLPVALDGWLGSALPSLRRKRTAVCRTTVVAVTIVALVAWVRGTLIRFQVYGPLRNYFATIVSGSFSIGGLTVSAGGILGAILILVATRLVARLLYFVLREEVLPRLRFRPGAGHSMVSLANYTVYGIGIVLAASAAGLSGTQVTVAVGALGVGIGFGLQNVINNFVSGLILIFERPIKVGDRVQTTDHLGRVTRIGIRASTIRRRDGADIIVPNGDLIAKEVINWTRSDDNRRIEVLVGVAYGTDPEAVLEILLRVAEEQPLALADPEPRAQMIRFGDSSLDFRLRCWTSVDEFVEVASNLHVAINKELEQAGIKIPFPQRDLHVRSTAATGEDEPSTVIEAIDQSA